MSHADNDYDHPIEHHDPKEGFDHSEPQYAARSGCSPSAAWSCWFW